MNLVFENLGLDLEIVALNKHHVRVQDRACPVIYAQGRGITQESALEDAQKNLQALLSTNTLFQNVYLGEAFEDAEVVHDPKEVWESIEDTLPEQFLTPSLWAHFDPERELLPDEIFDTNAGDETRGICALPFIHEASDDEVLFPVNIIANIYERSGLGVGESSEDAKFNALLKVVKQYVQKRVLSESLSLPEIETWECDASLQDELSGLKTKVYDASLEGVYPVIAMTFMNADGVKLVFGSASSFEMALQDAIVTFLTAKDKGFLIPTFDEERVSSQENIKTHYYNNTGYISYEFFKNSADFEYVPWSENVSYEELSKRVFDAGFDIYARCNHYLGSTACQVIVPNMSEVNPMVNLQWHNNNEGVQYRELILGLHDADEDDVEDFLEEIEDNEFDPYINMASFIGIIPDAGSVWEHLNMGELKAMLHLSVGEYEEALTWHLWALEQCSCSVERQHYFACIIVFLEVILDEQKEMVDYLPMLIEMYGATMVQVCNDLIQAKQKFYGLHNTSEALEVFQTHQKAIHIYKNLQALQLDFWENNDG